MVESLNLVRLSDIRVGSRSRKVSRGLIQRANTARLERGDAPLLFRSQRRAWWYVNIELLKTDLCCVGFVSREEHQELSDSVEQLLTWQRLITHRLECLGRAMRELEAKK